jgi:Na+-driven multidrug efflux pump
VNLSGYYQAIGKPGIAIFLALLRQFITLIPIILIAPIFFGEWGLWFAIPVADTVTTIIALYLYQRENRSSDLRLKRA